MSTSRRFKRHIGTHDKEQALEAMRDNTVLLARSSYDGRIYYSVVDDDYTLADLVYWGLATVEEKIEAMPTLTQKELEDAGLAWAYKDGAYVEESLVQMRDFESMPLDTRSVRMGTYNAYKLARESIGVPALHTGSEQDREEYTAVLKVLIASAKLEHYHDPEAVHMTPNMAHYVMVNADRVEDIVQFIADRRLTVRDIKLEILDDYLRNHHGAVNEGFL